MHAGRSQPSSTAVEYQPQEAGVVGSPGYADSCWIKWVLLFDRQAGAREFSGYASLE
jgi:hypothetical protein